MKDSEILKELISLAFDSDPAPTNLTLRQALDLLARTVQQEACSTRAERTGVENGNPPPQIPPSDNSGVTPCGRGAAEKRDTYDRLVTYRRNNGLGSLAAIEQAANRAVTEDELRDMLDGRKYPLPKWRVVAAALDYIEKKGQ